jgi:hypothetical protein
MSCSSSGVSFDSSSNNFFNASQISQVRQKYGSGPIVDAMNFLFAPASDGAIPSGAQAVYIYKTNASARASLALANAYGTVRALEFGVGGNTATVKAAAVAEVAPSVQSSVAFDESAVSAGSFYVYANGVKSTVTVAGGYRVYSWTGSGSITF